MHGVAGQHGGARRVRADPMLDPIGLSVDHAHIFVIHAKGVGADLGHNGFKSLADRRATGDELDFSLAIDGRARAVGRTPAAFVEEDAHPNAHHLAGVASA